MATHTTNTGTQTLTNKTIASHLAYTDVRFKSGSFTRDLTAGPGDVSYTTVGFQPKAIILWGTIDQTKNASLGFDDATTHNAIGYSSGGDRYEIDSGYAIYIPSATSNYQRAIIKSFDADGFTLTWSKANSPTGTATFYYLAFR